MRTHVLPILEAIKPPYTPQMRLQRDAPFGRHGMRVIKAAYARMDAREIHETTF
jgi:hypothetical protein